MKKIAGLAVETAWSSDLARSEQLEIRIMEAWSRKGQTGGVEEELHSFVDGKSQSPVHIQKW